MVEELVNNISTGRTHNLSAPYTTPDPTAFLNPPAGAQYRVTATTATGQTITGISQPLQSGPSGSVAWVNSYGGSLYNYGQVITVERSTGNIVTAGVFGGTTNWGAQDMTSLGGFDMVLAKYTPAGVALWTKRFGATGSESPQCIALDSAGSIFVGGFFSGTANLGGSNFTAGPSGDNDIFIAKYDRDGNHLWSKAFGGKGTGAGNGYDLLRAIAITPAGDVILLGDSATVCTYTSAYPSLGLTFDPNDIQPQNAHMLCSYYGLQSAYLAKLSGADGSYIWSRDFTTVGQSRGYGVTLDSSGNILITGILQGSMDFGGGAVTTGTSFSPFIAKLTSTGTYVWAKLFNNNVNYGNKAFGVVVNSSDDAFVLGENAENIDFGGGHVLTNSRQKANIWIAKFSKDTGACLWAVGSTSTASEVTAPTLAIDTAGNLVVAGTFVANITWSGTTLTSATFDAANTFVGKFSPGNGALIWITKFWGSSSSGNVTPVTAYCDGSNNVVVTGLFLGTQTFGTVIQKTNHTSYDAFIAKLNP